MTRVEVYAERLERIGRMIAVMRQDAVLENRWTGDMKVHLTQAAASISQARLLLINNQHSRKRTR